MRIRFLKPGFFTNEDLCELSPWHRLCFEGLWCCADREGRLEDRPKRLKAAIFPYDDLDMDLLLWDLSRRRFIVRYAQQTQAYIAIPTWAQHQRPRPDEAASVIPAYEPGMERAGGPDRTTFPATDPNSLIQQLIVPIVTDPSLPSDATATALRLGSGVLDSGSENLDSGERALAAHRAQDLIDLWNAVMKPPIPRCRELTEERRRKIRARMKTRPSLIEWRQVFEAIQSNPFMRGENDRRWVADFDYAIKNDTVSAKALERLQAQPSSSGQRWECPHTPPCPPGTTAWKCDQRTQIEAEKASVKATT